jgi:transglutaminase-like putative cysteine protease
MSIYKIHHITQYDYDRPVRESVNEMRIFPYACPEQEILQHELTITGQPQLLIFQDYWKNKAAVFNLLEPHQTLVIENKIIVRTTLMNENYLNYNSGKSAMEGDIANQLQLLELTKAELIQSQGEINDIIQKIDQPWKSIAGIVQDCSQYIYQYFKYIKGITTIESTVDEILEHRSGVCQDFAHVMLQILRSMKIPSRYVSGYICPNRDGLRGQGATHAWVEAWIPQHGWAGIDPTNNVWVTNKHIKLAVGRNFSDCSPIRGSFKGPAKQQLSVYVSVGYEDGHTFEDKTRVKLEPYTAAEIENHFAENFAAQQQQQ